MILRKSSSHEEGVNRHWSVLTKEFIGKGGHVEALRTVEVQISYDDNGRMKFDEREGSAKIWPAQLVLLAIGYVGPQKKGLINDMGHPGKRKRRH